MYTLTYEVEAILKQESLGGTAPEFAVVTTLIIIRKFFRV